MRSFVKSIFVLAVFAFLAARPILAGEQPRNIVLFIGDGMGMNHVQAASLQQAAAEQRSPVDSRLAFEEFPVTGYLTTYPAGEQNPVTDSAAAGTALACGVKTRNGMIGKGADGTNVDSIAVLAKRKGKAVGIVTSVGLDDATPAVFYAHAGSRRETDKILDQAFASTTFDVLMGGKVLCRGYDDEAVLKKKCEDSGIVYVSASGLESFTPAAAGGRRVMGCLFPKADTKSPASAAPGPAEAALPTMARKALDVLVSRASTNGFFIMVEAGKVDGQSHGTNTAAMIERVLELGRVVSETMTFLKEKGLAETTLVVVTADHETGGLVLAENTILKSFAKPATPSAAIPEASRIGKARASWTTGGHTCTWVPLFASGPEAQRFAGRHDNTDVAKIIANLMR